MSKTLITNLNITQRKAVIALMLCVLAFVVLTLTQDFLRANLNNTGYYFSESIMFSTFWWIFAPFLIAQYYAVKYIQAKQYALLMVIIVLPLITHLLAFPLLIWALSGIFYYHTFSVQQTLTYTLSEHSYLLVFFYTVPVSMYFFLRKTMQAADKTSQSESDHVTNLFSETILVSEANKKHLIAVADVQYFSANPPYINIHLREKKYLQNETLKSIATQLNPQHFIRIHKSTIINIKSVAFYTSRLNGDYDLTMKNGDILRISRNFASDFKQKYQESHQLTSK